MKKYFIVFLVFIAAVPLAVQAQERTLMGEPVESGGYLGPGWKISSIDNDLGILIGGRGGWVINRTFMLGCGIYCLASDIYITDSALTEANKLKMRYGGFVLEYIIMPDWLVHFSAHSLLGYGRVKYDPRDSYKDHFFVLEPGLNLEVNVTKWLRIGAGVTYRFINGVSGMPGISDSSLSGFTGELVFKFGYSSYKDFGYPGSGNVISETRQLRGFHSIRLTTNSTVNITQGSRQSIEIRGDDNIIPLIETEVSSGTLTISSKWGPMPISGVEINITMKDIEALHVSGSGKIFGENLIEADNADLKVSGSGDISLELNVNSISAKISGSGEIGLSGKTETLDIGISGSGDFYAFDLSAEDVYVTVSGSGNCEVNASEKLDVKISGSGDVEYTGNPRINSKISGSGSLESRD